MSARGSLIDAIWGCVVSGSSTGVLLASRRREVDEAISRLEAEAIEQERARLVAGVEGLSEGVHSWYAGSNLDHVSRSAVLALIRDTEGATE